MPLHSIHCRRKLYLSLSTLLKKDNILESRVGHNLFCLMWELLDSIWMMVQGRCFVSLSIFFSMLLWGQR